MREIADEAGMILRRLTATTYGVIRWKCARPPFEVCWPRLALACAFNEHMEGDGPTVFAHACKMGLEGIVSKRKDHLHAGPRSTGTAVPTGPYSGQSPEARS
jgi:hypothetical protein